VAARHAARLPQHGPWLSSGTALQPDKLIDPYAKATAGEVEVRRRAPGDARVRRRRSVSATPTAHRSSQVRRVQPYFDRDDAIRHPVARDGRVDPREVGLTARHPDA
jgi:hypothetical protein